MYMYMEHRITKQHKHRQIYEIYVYKRQKEKKK